MTGQIKSVTVIYQYAGIEKKYPRSDTLLTKDTYKLKANTAEAIFTYNGKIPSTNLNTENMTHLVFSPSYSNIANDLKYSQAKIGSKSYWVKYNLKYDWTITNESKKIGGYTCYKAFIKGNDPECVQQSDTLTFTAWFTPEIPLPFGPARFDELPGLILKIETPDYILRAQEIICDDNIKVIEKEDLKVITEEKRRQLFEDYIKRKP